MALIEGLSVLALSLAAMPLVGQGLPGVSALGFWPSGQERIVISGNVHPAVRSLEPMARTDGALPMERILMSFQMRPEAKDRLEHLLLEQQDPSAANYHKWLSPAQFASEFGPRADEIAKVAGWLGDQGFTVDEVAPGGMTIMFSGTASQVEQAFRTPMLDYQVEGHLRHANAADPSIPADLASLVSGVVSLHNIPRKPANTGVRALSPADPARLAGSTPQYTDRDGSHYLSPGDFATIYDLNSLYSAGIDGTGVTIGIVGRTNPGTAHWTTFRSQMGLSVNTPTIIINGTDPGSVSDDENEEADLDVEWAGAVATGATVKFVCSKSTSSTDGVDLSAQYIVNNPSTVNASVMSTSFGSCERDMGTTENQFYNNLWQQAAAEGITSCVASGDNGVAGCDSNDATKGTVAAVNGLASTPYNIAVGGTQFNEGTGTTYWSSTNTGYNSALKYIPEVVWNESGSTAGGSGLWSSSGGASNLYGKPSWQVAEGVPSGDHRYLPDVSLVAGGDVAYLVWTTATDTTTGVRSTGLWAVAGTSATSPSFAGMMALVGQAASASQGNANPTLYQFGATQYGGGAGVFHDITSGNNSVPGLTGFNAGAGYDEATGLGSVDGAALVNNWVATVTTPVNSVGLLTGRSATFTVTVSGTSQTGVTWSTTGNATIVAESPSTSATFTASSAGTYTVTATSAAAALHSATITVQVHDPDLMGSGSTVTGLDVLDVLGHYGTPGTVADVNGDGVVGSADLSIMLNLLGWN